MCTGGDLCQNISWVWMILSGLECNFVSYVMQNLNSSQMYKYLGWSSFGVHQALMSFVILLMFSVLKHMVDVILIQASLFNETTLKKKTLFLNLYGRNLQHFIYHSVLFWNVFLKSNQYFLCFRWEHLPMWHFRNYNETQMRKNA